MKRHKLLIFGVTLLLFGTGLWALADVNVLNITRANFRDGQVLSANALNTLLNDNFASLETAVKGLETGKQNRLGNPCPGGQFVRGVGADGRLDCAVDQVGSGGSAGVSSVNGKSGSLIIQAGANVTVNTADDGKITVSAAGGGGGLTLPYSGEANSSNAVFAVTNSGGNALMGRSTGGGIGVWGNSNARGVVGTQGDTSCAGTYAVGGCATTGIGVYGVSPNDSGVQGKTVNGNGVFGESQNSTGVYGRSTGGRGVWGDSTNGFGVYGRTASAGSSGIRGETIGTTVGYGVSGFSTSGIGVYGESVNNAGVFGRSTNNNAAFFTSGSGGSGSCSYNGGAGWNCTSDSNAKENFRSVDATRILESLVQMPVTSWTMKGDEAQTPHLGPTAQDFHAAFKLGDSDTTINSADAQGVALAAIQGLYQLVQEQETRIAELEARLAESR